MVKELSKLWKHMETEQFTRELTRDHWRNQKLSVKAPYYNGNSTFPNLTDRQSQHQGEDSTRKQLRQPTCVGGTQKNTHKTDAAEAEQEQRSSQKQLEQS